VFNGTRIVATGDTNSFISVGANYLSTNSALVGGGGAIIDTNGHNVGIAINLKDNGGGTLTKLGDGTLTVSGSNSYSGGTTLSSGSLQIGNANALGTGSLAVNGGTLDLHGYSASVGALSGTGGSVTNTGTGAATLTTMVTGSSTYAGNIAGGVGSVNLVKSGSGTLILSGSISMGGLSAGAGQVTLTQSGSIGTLDVYDTATVSLAANTSGTRSVLSVSSLAIGGTFTGMAAPVQPSATQLNADTLESGAITAALSAAAQGSNEPAAPEAVPEPGTAGLLLVGALGLLRLRRKGSRGTND